MQFLFTVDDDGLELCTEILQAMEYLYDIPIEEGLVLLNTIWAGNDFKSWREDIRYHETSDYWAGVIGNPCPYDLGDGDKIWRTRRDEAYRRKKIKLNCRQAES